MSETERCFFDTNVIVYLLSGDPTKAEKAEAVLTEGGVVSVQVLNEFASVAVRKLRMTVPEIRDFLTTIRAVCEVVPITLDTHDIAVDLADRHGFSIYDASIIAAARLANCTILYTEDLQSGRSIDGLRIVNPFR